MNDTSGLNGGDNSSKSAEEMLRSYVARLRVLETERADLGVVIKQVYADTPGYALFG
jgi:uncharacterized protein (UPF0335 family)